MIDNSNDNRFMEIKVGSELFAVPLLEVKEVILKPDVIPVPNAPKFFEGMINLRGQILGVFDVRKKLVEKYVKQENKREVVVIFELASGLVGMSVDEVTRVLQVKPDMIEAASLRDKEAALKYIDQIIKTGSEVVQTLRPSKLLGVES